MTTTGIDPLAIGTEIRLGRRFTENAATKSLRYLLEGRVQIRHVGPQQVAAEVRGSGQVWKVIFSLATGWACNCPARTPLCCHVRAVQTVVTV